MFTLPPRPPKDYFLKNVTGNQATSEAFTPSAHPRATQASIAKYCYPIPADDEEPIDKSTLEQMDDSVFDNWTKAAKALWVDKPGENAYYLHDMYKKFYVVVDPDYDPRYKNRPKVFQRSYKYELDCMEHARLQKLKRKIQREEEIDKQVLKTHAGATSSDNETIVGCQMKPPFWWKQAEDDNKASPGLKGIAIQPSKSTYQASYRRWQEKPKPIQTGHNDFCKRRNDLFRVGQQFKHEACTWYFKNYPPPNIKFIPERFAK